MSGFQRLIEVNNSPTGYFVVFDVSQIRRAYATVMDSPDTIAPVKNLTKVLLEDFDKCYHPPSNDKINVGKVCYTPIKEIGFKNRYTCVHPYFFVLEVLVPRMKNNMKGELFQPQMGQFA